MAAIPGEENICVLMMGDSILIFYSRCETPGKEI
jgi:hypothetical protein